MAHETCGCCEGIEVITPVTITNRPGLPALAYRVGTHGAFLATMKARLTAISVTPAVEEPGAEVDTLHPLRLLTTRAGDDPAIALLDGWATVADVLTFYQERIANEGYLRTATERRSVLELARLVGYAVRPGVASTVYLAYEVDPTYSEPVEIEPGARVQSVPGPGELPQAFETRETLEARAAWNKLKPRMTRPQTTASIINRPADPQREHEPRLYLQGVNSNLRPNDPLLIRFTTGPELRRVLEVVPDPLADRTLVRLQPWLAPTAPEMALRSASIWSEAVEERAWCSYLEAVRTIVEKYLDVAAFNVDPNREMAQRVIALLKELDASLEDDPRAHELTSQLQTQVLPQLHDEQTLASEGGFTLLAPWVSGLVDELEAAMTGATTMLAEMAAVSFAPLPFTPNGQPPRAVVHPLASALGPLVLPPSTPPANALRLERRTSTLFAAQADIGLQVAASFTDDLRTALPVALANVPVAPPVPLEVYVLRAKARPFGHNAPARTIVNTEGGDTTVSYTEWELGNPFNQSDDDSEHGELDSNGNVVTPVATHSIRTGAPVPTPNTLYLDADYNIAPRSWVVIEKEGEDLPIIAQPVQVSTLSAAGYGIQGNSTRLDLGESDESRWMSQQDTFQLIRTTVVHAQSERLELAEEPVTEDIAGATLELDTVYSGLQSGRWLIVAGERSDILDADGASIPGIKGAELVMLAEVRQDVRQSAPAGDSDYVTGATRSQYGSYADGSDVLAGEKTHSFLTLSRPLAYRYKRDQVTIYGNVVKATHGETRNEVLGSGDASKTFQSFALRQPPLTYVPAATPAGVESTLKVYINDVEWHEAATLAGLTATDRSFTTRIDDDGKTTVVFGNGRRGALLPTGTENVKAVYRNGIGKAGNVAAEQISQLATRPLGVQGVINPLRATGGADREPRDQARRNAPLAVMALDRLVSVQDYADFARTFAGIGKATAQRLSDGRRQLVHITIAGADDIPIDPTSDLYQNLVRALRRYGDPDLPVQVDLRELQLLVISAGVHILPDYLWEPVVTRIRARLYEAFHFDRRELGQDVLLSEVISTIQAVDGVAYVDVDLLRGIPEKTTDEANPNQRRLLSPTEITAKIGAPLTDEDGVPLSEPVSRLPVRLAEVVTTADNGGVGNIIRPAELAFLSPTTPDMLILNPI
jgi:predicted phage baseplate assembly protein